MENDCASHEHLKQPNIERLIDSETHEATLIQVFFVLSTSFVLNVANETCSKTLN